MKVFILTALAIVAVSSETFPKDGKFGGRITNGYIAYEGKAPYTVGLSLNVFGVLSWCGGSIIGHTWVLTAAHCTNNAESVTIYYGAIQRLEAQLIHEVGRDNIIKHHRHDIALIRTPYVDFWAMVNKVEIPNLNDQDNSYEGWWAVTCGWGRTHDTSALSNWLRCADLQVISNAKCSLTYGPLPDEILCVSTYGGKSTCLGDIGGPLVTHDNPKLIGIAAFVSGNGCTKSYPAGYIRVSSHLDWIRNISGVAYY